MYQYYFHLPKFENQEEPLLKISGTTETVSTFETVVGQPYKPTFAGKGGFNLGCPFLPSRLSKRADSSPQIYAPAPLCIKISRSQSVLKYFFLKDYFHNIPQ